MFRVVIAFPKIDDILRMEERRSRSGNNKPSESRMLFKGALLSVRVSIFGQRFSLLQTSVESRDRRCESNTYVPIISVISYARWNLSRIQGFGNGIHFWIWILCKPLFGAVCVPPIGVLGWLSTQILTQMCILLPFRYTWNLDCFFVNKNIVEFNISLHVK